MNPREYLGAVAVILTTMAAAALLEAAFPLFATKEASAGRRRANLAMTAQTLIFNFVLTSAAGMAALVLPLASPGIMARIGLPASAQFVVGILVLDFSFGYVAHRALHVWPFLWRFHRVHHSDPFIDVTTTYRNHPGEHIWRFLSILVPTWVFGVPASAVILYRLLSSINGVLEHANFGLRPRLDSTLARVWVTPNMHKVHHSRDAAETDTNYGNLLSLYDRLLGTFTPSERALTVVYGLDDVGPDEALSFVGMNRMPWRAGKLGRKTGAANSLVDPRHDGATERPEPASARMRNELDKSSPLLSALPTVDERAPSTPG